MWQGKRKTKWWLWLIRLVILAMIIMAWWMVWHQNDIPDFDQQLLDSLSSTSASPTQVNSTPVVEDSQQLIDEQVINDGISDPVVVGDDEAVESTEAKNDFVILEVPFTSQAPKANWEDDRFQDGCEEASVLMAMAWVKQEKLSKTMAQQAILDLAEYQLDNYGGYHDTNASDTANRLLAGYYQYNNFQVVSTVSIASIIKQLSLGNLVLVPTNGQRLANPYYTPPGPETHMLVIKGYDPATNEFITNDPGTKRGESYRYNVSVLVDAVLDYPTGYHETVMGEPKAMIIIKK